MASRIKSLNLSFSLPSWQLFRSLIVSLLGLSPASVVFSIPSMHAEDRGVVLNLDIWYAISKEVSTVCKRSVKFGRCAGN